VLLYTGMREGEVLAMQWANLDWRTGAYRLTHDLDRDTFELDTLKTDAARRTVYLPRELLARLGEHKLEHDMLKESDPTWNPLNLVFCTSVGTAIRPNNLWRHFKAVCRLLGFPPNTTVHHLRHTWRHHAADRMDAATMRDWLGHTETDTTLAVYGEGVSDRAKRRAGVELDRLYEED
jgi:integrase